MSRLLSPIRVVLLMLSAVSVARATLPSITAGDHSGSYTENGAAAQIDTTIAVFDDGSDLASATVQITTNFVAGDQLNFSNQNNISGSYDSGTGILTLSGVDTLAHYQAALMSVKFSSTSDDPTDLLSGVPKTGRTITWGVNDGTDGPSSLVTSTITVSAVDDAPTLTALPATMTITEDTQSTFNAGGHEFLDVVFADVDSPSVTVTIAMTLTSGGTPTGSFDLAAGSGVTLSATLQPSFTVTGAPVDVRNYIKQPSNFLYTPATNLNGSGVLTLTVSANDHDGFIGTLGTSTITITAVNDAPTFTGGATLAAVYQDTANPPGATVSSLLGAKFSDVDIGNSFGGIVVTANASSSVSEGKWQYSTNGGSTWTDLPAVSTSAGLMLETTAKLRFLPNAGYNGTPGSLTVYADDDTSTTLNGAFFDTTTDDLTSSTSAAGVSLATSITATTAPGAPTIGTATAGIGQADVAFTAPASDGGSAVTSYTATASPGGATATGAASPLTVTGLTNGTAYTFTVTATNAVGTGAASSASNSVTPKANQTITFANPGAQTFGTSPTLGASSTSGLTVTFTSSTPGVATITSGGALTFVSAGTATINADQAGNAAFNAASQVTQSFTVNAIAPGAPTIGTATAGNTNASVAFTGPGSNGGASISGYTVTANPGGATGTGGSSPITVPGLTNGVAYTFTVTATNSAGTGAASSASNSVTPKAPQTITFANPGAQNFGTTPTVSASSDSSLTVTFTSSTPSVATVTAGGALTFLSTGTATINADQAGNGSFLAATQVSRSFTVNAVVPAAPTIGTASPGDTQATVAFTAPTFTGGATITGYTVTSNPGGITGTGAASPITVGGLTNGVSYTFTVTATNSAGTGSASAASNSVTPNPGPAVVSVNVPANGTYKAGQNLDFTISWDQNTTVTGTPQLALTIGATTVQANYVSSPTATTALFRYTVLAGQTDANGIAIGALTLNGGTIQNGTGTDATLTLNSVASTASVLVDTTAPTINSIARNNPATVNTNGTTATWRATFSEAVTGVDIGDFQLTVLGGNAAGTIASVTPGGAGIYDVAVNSISGQGQLRLDLKASGTGIADTATNALSGGFTGGDFYQVGVTNVFDAVALATGTTRTVANLSTNQVAQRFTTSAGAPLTVTNVMAALGTVSGTPVPVVTINADNAGVPGTVVATLTNPGSLTSNTLATWTGSALLTASTTYWVVFADTSLSASYAIKETALTSGGTGAWLGGSDYAYYWGANHATGPQAGALQIAIGAGTKPVITSLLTASADYNTAFTYTVTASNLPTSYSATGLPSGLTINTSTGVISGSSTATGAANVTIGATNLAGTGTATLVLTVAGSPNQSASVNVTNTQFVYDGKAHGVTVTTSPAGLTTQVIYNNDPAGSAPVDAGTYPVTARVSQSGYVGFTTTTLTITKATQTITFAAPVIRLGTATTLSATASSGLAVNFTVVSGPATVSANTLTASGNGQVTVRAAQGGNANFQAATNVDYTVTVEGAPMPIVSSGSGVLTPGSSVTLTQPTTLIGSTTQWQRDGSNLIGGTGSTITLSNLQPSDAGLYSSTSTLAGGIISTSEPAIVGLSTTQKVIGSGEEVGGNIIHPNGNTYDQVLLEGKGASLTADKGQVTRVSFIDLSNDIVQVEFSGAGTLSVVMADASAPSAAANYNQPGVDYVRGHAGLVITGADETSNLNIFTVGKSTAVNQSLFKDGTSYDGVADVAYVAIQSTNGKFGGIRTGNVHFWATQGMTGVYAPGVQVAGPTNIGNVDAFDSATPVLIFGSAGTVNITGGNLKQTNSQPVQVSGITALKFVDGSTSGGTTLKAQANQAVLIENGVNVTARIVVNP